MSEDALIRRTNLKALGLTPTDLVTRVGKSYQYWRDLMSTDKSFGEKTARNIEDKLGLQRGQLDMVILDKAHRTTTLVEVKSTSTENLQKQSGQLIAFTAVPRQKQDDADHFVLPQFETGGGNGDRTAAKRPAWSDSKLASQQRMDSKEYTQPHWGCQPLHRHRLW